ncbi:MAG TPA: N-acetylmuramoyl-L-alanine amidase [Fimbriimonadaceae bacterium]|nr:N-acetylmuramoyl-L-alanine amidase [Fimbriimonadaceae bacterium]
MTLKELDAQLNLQYIPIPSGKRNRPGGKTTKTSITIHNTSNTGKGAHALAHSAWVNNTGFYWLKDKNGKPIKKNYVSWHYTVDELRVVKHLPVHEHAIHSGKAEGNKTSIGIEICMNSDMDFAKASDRAAKLVAVLMKALDIPLSAVYTHYDWTGKKCPALMLDGGQPGAKWDSFKAKVMEYVNAVSGPKPAEESEPDPGDLQPE